CSFWFEKFWTAQRIMCRAGSRSARPPPLTLAKTPCHRPVSLSRRTSNNKVGFRWKLADIFAIVMRVCYANGLSCSLHEGNGRGGIRTHGGFPHARFRVECLNPDSATLPLRKKERRTVNVQHPTSNANITQTSCLRGGRAC